MPSSLSQLVSTHTYNRSVARTPTPPSCACTSLLSHLFSCIVGPLEWVRGHIHQEGQLELQQARQADGGEIHSTHQHDEGRDRALQCENVGRQGAACPACSGQVATAGTHPTYYSHFHYLINLLRLATPHHATPRYDRIVCVWHGARCKNYKLSGRSARCHIAFLPHIPRHEKLRRRKPRLRRRQAR